MKLKPFILAMALAFCTAEDVEYCHACFEGFCYSRHVLIKGFNITDQMAIDRKNHVLYVQLQNHLNTAVHLDQVRMTLVQDKSTTGLAFDEDNQVLYTADESGFYLTKKDSVTESIIKEEYKGYLKPDRLCYKENIHFSSSRRNGIYLLKENYKLFVYTNGANYKYNHLVITQGNMAYFQSNNSVYSYNFASNSLHLIAKNNYNILVDKDDEVYFSDGTIKVIYKLDKVSNALVADGEYRTGAADRFEFDKDNNIVYHDAADGNVYHWKKQVEKCSYSFQKENDNYDYFNQ